MRVTAVTRAEALLAADTRGHLQRRDLLSPQPMRALRGPHGTPIVLHQRSGQHVRSMFASASLPPPAPVARRPDADAISPAQYQALHGDFNPERHTPGLVDINACIPQRYVNLFDSVYNHYFLLSSAHQ